MNTTRSDGFYWVRLHDRALAGDREWSVVEVSAEGIYTTGYEVGLDDEYIAEWGPRIECPAGYLREFRGDSARSAHMYAAEAEHQSLGPHSVLSTAELDALRRVAKLAGLPGSDPAMRAALDVLDDLRQDVHGPSPDGGHAESYIAHGIERRADLKALVDRDSDPAGG